MGNPTYNDDVRSVRYELDDLPEATREGLLKEFFDYVSQRSDAEGDPVEALHFGLFFKNPMTVRLNGALIAMRSAEARCVYVTTQSVGGGT